MNKSSNTGLRDVINGALVADAAAMGVHWIYDQSHLATLADRGDILFCEPDAANYASVKGYFAHAGRAAGDLSHYGESARLVAQLVGDREYSTDAHREGFMSAFGPCGYFSGYADRPTKALVAKMLLQEDKLDDPSGSDDDQMPALCVVPGLFAADVSLDTTLAAVQVLSINKNAISAAATLYTCLNMLRDGANQHEALTVSAKASGGELCELLLDALSLESYQPLQAAERFGLPCHVQQGLPVVWHLFKHATNFKSVIRDNILCGGDSCGRAMALGALAGSMFGVPDELSARISPGILLD